MSHKIRLFIGVQNFFQIPILFGYLVWQKQCCIFINHFLSPPTYRKLYCLYFRTFRQGHVTVRDIWTYIFILCPKVSIEFFMHLSRLPTYSTKVPGAPRSHILIMADWSIRDTYSFNNSVEQSLHFLFLTSHNVLWGELVKHVQKDM